MKKIIFFFLLCSSNISFGMSWLTGEPASTNETSELNHNMELNERDKAVDLEYEMAKDLPQESDPQTISKHYPVATARAYALQTKKQKDNVE